MITGKVTFSRGEEALEAVLHDGFRWECRHKPTETFLNESFGAESIASGDPVLPSGYWNLERAARSLGGSFSWMAGSDSEPAAIH